MGDDVGEVGNPEILEEELGDHRRCTASIDRVRDRAQCLEARPHRRALVADEVTPAAGALLLALFAAAIGDRSGAGDVHDPAARGIPGIERGDGVVRHEQPRAGRRHAREQLTSALAVGLPIATRAREHDRIRGPTAERFGEGGADGSLRVG